MNVLLIEDDDRVAEFVTDGFRRERFDVTRAKDGLEGSAAILHGNFDAAVVDIMLPGLDGLSVIRRAREAGHHIPIIVLSAKGSVEEKVQGLECGADDYLSKPFSITELIARVQALMRRAAAVPETTILRVGDLTMDLVTHRVTRGDARLDLQPLEYQLLEYFMRNAGRVISKTTIMERVWGYAFNPHTNVVECRVSHLRTKLAEAGGGELIRTIRGFGYVLEAT